MASNFSSAITRVRVSISLFIIGVVVVYLIFLVAPALDISAIERGSDKQISLSVTYTEQVDSQTAKLDPVERLVDGLRRRLERQPGDVQGWVLLVESYYYLERWEQASAALKKARSLGYTDQIHALAQFVDIQKQNKVYPLYQPRDMLKQQSELMSFVEKHHNRADPCQIRP